ncbi:unnamed protein product [Paramecium pentaurelia]|uniref:Transmembrane protein n=1 Tax=Paramecium pentaurelia TaxID=43138 RepID=A0A8S1TZZ9_9CILI|nr:unnamed protein product [Paramecium pentaurelia]
MLQFEYQKLKSSFQFLIVLSKYLFQTKQIYFHKVPYNSNCSIFACTSKKSTRKVYSKIKIWDIELIHQIKMHNNLQNTLWMLQLYNLEWIIQSGNPVTLIRIFLLWNLEQLKLIIQLDSNSSWILDFSFSSDGNQMVQIQQNSQNNFMAKLQKNLSLKFYHSYELENGIVFILQQFQVQNSRKCFELNKYNLKYDKRNSLDMKNNEQFLYIEKEVQIERFQLQKKLLYLNIRIIIVQHQVQVLRINIQYDQITCTYQQEISIFLIVIKVFLIKIVITVVKNVMVQFMKIVYLVQKSQREFIYLNIKYVFVLTILLMIKFVLVIKKQIQKLVMNLLLILNVNMVILNLIMNVTNVHQLQGEIQLFVQSVQTSQTEKQQMNKYEYLIFDGNYFHLYYSNENEIIIDNENYLYQNFLEKSAPFGYFCKNLNIYYRCEEFIDVHCKVYYFSMLGIRQQKKLSYTLLQTHTNECKLCTKQNCIYCFEYSYDEYQFKSTLYKNFESFFGEQMIQVGCAMCQDGFIFDFTIGECLKQQSKIETCLRSFINQDGVEVCTLSSSTDFSIAPEIINCEKYYSNCQQCFLTPKSKLQCVLCKQGYVSSVITGNCQDIQNPEFIQNSFHITQGDYLEQDGYIQMLQSFLMLFLPDKYYYSYSPQQLVQIPIKCIQGYELTKNLQCKEYCNRECLDCYKDEENFICKKCPLNYYRKHIKSEILGKCITCSNLCKFCDQRNKNDYLYELSSSIQEQEQNGQFVMKCLKPIDHPNIIIDPYLQIAKYCLNDKCQNQFSFSLTLSQCLFKSFSSINFEDYINFKYCNLVGVDLMTINFIIQLDHQGLECNFLYELSLLSNLKKKIFSLKKTKYILNSVQNDHIITTVKFNIKNFDQMEVKNITLLLLNGFNFENNQDRVDITFKNMIFLRCNITDIAILQTQNLWKYSFLRLKIQKLTFKNCLLNNSLLFNIGYNQKMIMIENIIIENCSIYHSSFFYFQTDLININQIKLQDVEIYQCKFTFSYFFKTNIQFEIKGNNLFFHHNNLQNSAIIGFNDNLELITIRTSQNNLIESSIISLLLIINQQRVLCIIDDFEDNQSSFQESNLISIYSSLQINKFIVRIKNVKVYENRVVNTLYLENSLIKLHCHYFQVQNALFFSLQNIVIFQLFEINQIIFDSVLFQNSQQEHKVPISSFFLGFQQLSLSNIKIENQFSINYSIIDINFSIQYIIDSIGLVVLTNVQFQGNILLKNKQATLLSLVNIYSQYNLNIKLINIQFTQNILNSQIDDPFETQTNLLHLSSLDSSVYIHHMYCYQNALTNSTNQFITLTATLIEISDLIFMNQNILPQQLWQQFYDFELDDQYKQQQITQIIQSTFKFLNQGIYIAASNFSCTDSIFQGIIALKSSVFQINTLGEGIIKISNIQINTVQTNLQNSGSTGCISIDSTKSLLNIELKQIKFTNIFNRMAASLFTITPSLKQNIIRLNNIEIKNFLSLMNSIILVKFTAQIIEKNLVIIKNLSIYQSEELWIQLYSLIDCKDNAMILLENCKTEITNLSVKGIAIFPIFKFYNAFKLKLFDCNLISIIKIYSFDLIHISQTQQTQSTIFIQNLKIIQSDTYNPKSVVIPILSDLNYKIVGCSVWRPTSIKSEIIFSEIINQIQSLNQESSQIMYVKSISNQNLLMFQQIQFMNNNGSDFLNGIITFEIQQFKIFKLNDIFCYMNNVNRMVVSIF